MRFAIASVTVMVLLGCPLGADETQSIEMVIQARAIETPVLKYRLLPKEADLKPGNAVPILLRLPWEQTTWMSQVFPNLKEWEQRSLTAPEWKKFEGVLPGNMYNEMKRAAFRRDASWEYPIGETESLYLILLPDVQGLRGFLGYGLSAKIRYHLSRGELDAAREAIVVGLANSRHLAQTPFYVNQLVALAIDRSMLERTAELISQPNSPNLYWALSTLPDSLIQMDRAASLGGNAFAMTFPAVNDLDRPRDAKEWRQMANQLLELLEQIGEIVKQERPNEKDNTTLIDHLLQRFGAAVHPQLARFAKCARVELPRLLNISEKAVAAMSDEEAGVRWYVQMRQTLDQHSAAVLALSPREAWPRLKQLQIETKSMREKVDSKANDVLEPTGIYVAAWSLKRRIHSLRIIEAVRNHLAMHGGSLPQSLDDIIEVSIPLDPLTDQPFQWKVDGHTAILKAPPLPTDVIEPGSTMDRGNALEYRLLVK